MQFRGKVDRESHEGGLLVSFTGEAPHLGTALETGDGTYIGKVDTVIGRVDCALVHILPMARELDVSSIGDSEITIQQRRQRDDRRRDNRRGGRQEQRGRGRNDRYDRRGQGGNRGGDRGRSGGNRGGDRGGNDWDCPECHNNNFAWRDTCNRCPTKRPKNAGGGGGRSNYGGNRGGGRDNRGGNRDSKRGDRGGARHWGNRDGGAKKEYHRKKQKPNNPFHKKRDD